MGRRASIRLIGFGLSAVAFAFPFVARSPAQPSSAPYQPLPDIIPSAKVAAKNPLWVSGNHAIVDGQLRRELLSPSTLSAMDLAVEVVLSAKPNAKNEDRRGDCDVESVLTARWPRERTLLELVDESAFVVEGIVRQAASGFGNGKLSTLLEIEVSRVLRAPSAHRGLESLLALYPGGKLTIDGLRHCQRHASRSAGPEAGNNVLLLFDDIVSDAPLVVKVQQSRFFFEMASGEVSWPRSIRSWTLLEGRLDALLEGVTERQEREP